MSSDSEDPYPCDGCPSLSIITIKTPTREKKKSLQESWTTAGTDDLSPLSCDCDNASPGAEFGFFANSPAESMKKHSSISKSVGTLPLFVKEDDECVDPGMYRALVCM